MQNAYLISLGSQPERDLAMVQDNGGTLVADCGRSIVVRVEAAATAALAAAGFRVREVAGSRKHYVLCLAGPLRAAWKDELERLGVDLVERLAAAQYLVELEENAGRAVSRLDFVESLVPYCTPFAAQIGVDPTPQQARLAAAGRPGRDLWSALPRPLLLFVSLLLLDFIGVFIYAFIEPQMVFFFSDGINAAGRRFGLVVGAYGLATVLGQMFLGQLSDRYGRQPMIVLGFVLSISLYIGLVVVRDFGLLLAVAAVAGLGNALLVPALSAYYLDITAAAHRARIMGLKESAANLGGVAGPLLLSSLGGWLTAQQIFLISGVLAAAAVVLALLALGPRRRGAAGRAEALPLAARPAEWAARGC